MRIPGNVNVKNRPKYCMINLLFCFLRAPSSPLMHNTINCFFRQLILNLNPLLHRHAIADKVICNISKRFLTGLNNYIKQLHQLFLCSVIHSYHHPSWRRSWDSRQSQSILYPKYSDLFRRGFLPNHNHNLVLYR